MYNAQNESSVLYNENVQIIELKNANYVCLPVDDVAESLLLKHAENFENRILYDINRTANDIMLNIDESNMYQNVDVSLLLDNAENFENLILYDINRTANDITLNIDECDMYQNVDENVNYIKCGSRQSENTNVVNPENIRVNHHNRNLENVSIIEVVPDDISENLTEIVKDPSDDVHVNSNLDDSYNTKCKSTLKIISSNITGWTENNCDLRQSILINLKADIICIQESHGDDKKDIKLEGYQWIPFNRKTKHVKSPHTFGGVGIFVSYKILEDFEVKITDKIIDGIIGILLTEISTDKSYAIYSCYLPPINSIYGRDSTAFFSHLLTEIYKNCDVDGLIICGDFNSRIGDLLDFVPEIDNVCERDIIDNVVNQHGKSFIEFLNEAKCCILNGRSEKKNNNYTCIRNGASVVDYVVTPHENLNICLNFKVLPMSDIIDQYKLHSFINERSKPPDHSVLLFELKLSDSTYGHNTTINQTPPSNSKIRRYNLKCINNNIFTSDMARNALDNVIDCIIMSRENQENIDMLYENLCSAITTEMENEVPFKEFNVSDNTRKKFKSNKPFWNDELKILWSEMHEKEKIFCRCKKNNREKKKFKNDFIYARKVFDKSLKFHERSYNRGHTIEIEKVCTTNPNAFWQHIKNLGPKSKNKIPVEIILEDGTTINKTDEVYNKWKSDFEGLYNPNDNNPSFNKKFKKECSDTKLLFENNMLDPLYLPNISLNKDITIQEVNFVVNKAKNNKACGIDTIPYEILKNKPIINILLKLFQFCLDTALIPSIWRKSIVHPIPKDRKNDKRIPLNYRGISLICNICKLYSSILNKRMLEYLDTMGLLVDEQNGFRPRRSCQEQIFTLTSILRNNLNQNKEIFCTFIDFKKAFDSIDRELLLYKLLLNNVNGKIYNSIKGLYYNTEACVRINNVLTDWFLTGSGVKQGDSLSTTLFSLYVNGLAENIKKLNIGITVNDQNISILLYADDIALIANTAENMNKMLEVVQEYCCNWRLTINYNKSKVIHFRKINSPQSDNEIKIGDNVLEYVTEYKYLGVLLHEHMSYEYTANMLASSAGRALGSIINKFKSIKNMNIGTYEKLFNTCVQTVMHYSSCVWGFRIYDKCNQVIYKALRFYLGVHKYTPILGLLGDTGWLPSEYDRWLQMLRFWNHLINLNDDRIIKSVFLEDYNRCKGNWCSEIKQLFQKIEMNECFKNISYCDTTVAKLKLRKMYIDEWNIKRKTQPKLRTYNTFKEEFCLEKYVMMNLTRKERSYLCQFRLGILPIRIETGRYIGEKAEKRLCEICKDGNIEDETHIVLKCNIYDHLRIKYLPSEITSNITLNTTEKLNIIINEFCGKISRYIVEIMELRSNIINVKTV